MHFRKHTTDAFFFLSSTTGFKRLTKNVGSGANNVFKRSVINFGSGNKSEGEENKNSMNCNKEPKMITWNFLT